MSDGNAARLAYIPINWVRFKRRADSFSISTVIGLKYTHKQTHLQMSLQTAGSPIHRYVSFDNGNTKTTPKITFQPLVNDCALKRSHQFMRRHFCHPKCLWFFFLVHKMLRYRFLVIGNRGFMRPTHAVSCDVKIQVQIKLQPIHWIEHARSHRNRAVLNATFSYDI